MHSGMITNAIIHNLSLAIAYGGPTFGRGLRKAVLQGVSNDKERGKVMEIAWNEFNKINVPAHLAFTATWAVERSAIKRYFGSPAVDKLVTIKDVAIGGALLTGVANVVAGKMMQREFPEGVAYPAIGNVSPEKAEKIARYVDFFRVMGPLNHALIGASIALNPVLGANVVRQTARGMLARLFKR